MTLRAIDRRARARATVGLTSGKVPLNRAEPSAPALALQSRTQPAQLGPVPHQLAQLPRRGRGDPRLGQPTHPQRPAG